MKNMPYGNEGYESQEQRLLHRTPTPVLRISSATSMAVSDYDIEDPCRALQKGFLFLKDKLHKDEKLLTDLYDVCEERFTLTDDEKKDGGLSKTRKTLVKLINKGNDPCRRFLDKLKACSGLYDQFLQVLHHEPNTGRDAEKFTVEKLDYHEKLLIEEIEPTYFSDTLLCYLVLNAEDHILTDGKSNRKEKATHLISCIRENSAKLPMFYQALVDSKCSNAILEACRSCERPLPEHPETCVRINFRNLWTQFQNCKRKNILYNHLKQRNFIAQNPLPKQCLLIKAGLRKEIPGCQCILKLIQDVDNIFLEKLISRLEERERNGRKRFGFSIDIPEEESLKKFLIKEIEPTPISNVLLEEKAFSEDDHDDVNRFQCREDRAKALYTKLLEKKSPWMLENFLFALEECKSVLLVETLRHGRIPENHPETTAGEEDPSICIARIGGTQNIEDIELSSRLELILSIPVHGDSESIYEAVDRINNNVNLREGLVQSCHMDMVSANVGSVVLKLVPLTDDACRELLAEEGAKVKKMMKILLKHSNLRKEMIGGVIEVKVLISGNKAQGKKEETNIAELEFKGKMGLLQEEIEPSILVERLQRKGVFTKEQYDTIMKGKSRKEKVDNLLNTLRKEKGSDARNILSSSLEELGNHDIAAKIKPTTVNHEEAEFVRKGLLNKFSEVIDEMESNIYQDTFQQCGLEEDSLEKIVGKSRKERALNFLMTIMANDVYVLALKNVLLTRNLGDLFKMQKEGQEMPMEESNTGQTSKGAEGRKYKEGDVIFECKYEVDLKGEEKMEVDSSSDSEPMDIVQFSSGPKEMPWKHEPPPPMKISQKKPFQAPKSIPQVKTTQLKSKQQQQQQKQQQTSKSKTKPASQEKGKIFGLGKQEKTNDTVVVAIDFGTTYSGFAIMKKGQIITGKWKISSEEALESLKTPTALLLQPGKEPKFGYEAEKTFKELTEEGTDINCNFFNKFKMCLHRQKSFDTDFAIGDHLGRPFKALHVFERSIQFLKKECNNCLEENNFKVSDDEIQWVLSVPSIWDESAKQFMRTAAEKAGIPPDQLILALEPEAAAIYVTKEAKTVLGKESLQSYAPGTKIMLADLGGGTADFTVMELLEDGKMKQYYRAFGGAWGGNMINQKIWQTMSDIFGDEVIRKFKNLRADYMEMEHEIELRKRNLTDGSKLQLTIFPNFADLCAKLRRKDYKKLIEESVFSKDIKVRTGKLVFEPKAVEHIFELTLSALFANVRKVLENPNVRGIKDIILVGGFSQSDIIVNQFKKRFPRYKVIIPIEPELAVLKGAAMFGQDSDIITARISPHTYGFYSMRYFMEGDPESKRENIDGTDYCKDVFQKLVTIGDLVDVDHMVVHNVYASSAVMKQMFIKFYQTNEKNAKFVTDEGCECIGELIVDMPDTTRGKERSVEVSVFFGETEISVKGLDLTSNKLQEAKLNLLMKK